MQLKAKSMPSRRWAVNAVAVDQDLNRWSILDYKEWRKRGGSALARCLLIKVRT